MAFQHSCPNVDQRVSHCCPRNRPGKGPKRCPGCGGIVQTTKGRYGIFRFDLTNRRYGPNDYAPGTRLYERPAAAGAEADRRSKAARQVDPNHRGYVVRFIPS